MAYRIPVTKKEVIKAKELYAAGYSVQEISLELNRTGNTVRRMIHGFYDNLEPKKPKEKDKEKEKPLWQVCFETEWENAVNRIRKAMGKEPI
nr:MAG TPA: GcrA cell cycle regulator [Bacteriophage sp.]